jgi:uncharacterized protein YlxW (UPF0749 family)
MFMAWLSRFFKKEQAEESVDISGIESWVEKKARPEFEAADRQAKSIFSEVEPVKKAILEKLEVLEKAELRNKDIQQRIKNFMLGNRENYITQAKMFVNTLPAFSEYFFEQMQSALNIFAKHTARSYAILQEFFADETQSIASEIKKLNDISKRINDICSSSRIALIKELQAEVAGLGESLQKKDSLKKSNEQLESEIAKLKEEVEKLKKAVDDKRQSSDALTFNNLVDDKAMLDARMKNIDFGFNDLFSPLKRVLRKYARLDIGHEKLIEEYVSSPLHALLKDEEFEIVGILAEMQAKIGLLSLDADEKKKVLQRIAMFPKEKFAKTVESYKKDEASVQKLQDEISKMTISEDIAYSQEKVIAVSAMIEKKQKQIEENRKEFGAVDVQGSVNLIRELAAKAFGSKLNINL